MHCIVVRGVGPAPPSPYVHTHPHIRLTALFPGLPGWAGTRKVKPIWILLKQATVSGSGISWAICKSAPRSREITMPAPHYSVFYRPDALPAAQPTASKHWRLKALNLCRAENFTRFNYEIFEICKQTDIRADCSTSHCSWKQSNKIQLRWLVGFLKDPWFLCLTGVDHCMRVD